MLSIFGFRVCRNIFGNKILASFCYGLGWDNACDLGVHKARQNSLQVTPF